MIRERIADDIYVFTSRRYAQVTCGAVLTKEGVILIDTLFFPDEARAVRDFLEERLELPVRYVINTHYHADHITGTYLYPHATIVGHQMSRDLLDTVGREGLKKTQEQLPEFEEASIVLPSMVLCDGELDVTLGNKTFRLIHTPGHSPDLCGVHILNDNIFFAADTMMTIPTFFDGSFDELQQSLNKLSLLAPDSVVQGHGEVILRGEVQHAISNHFDYMNKAREEVEMLIEEGMTRDSLDQISVESCGQSRIALNGMVSDLHLANLYWLYDELTGNKET